MSQIMSMLDQAINALTGVTEEAPALVKDFAHKLVSSASAKWISEGKSFLRCEPAHVKEQSASKIQQTTKKVLAVWRAITVGGTTIDRLVEAIEKLPASISDWSRNLFGRPGFWITREVGTADLVIFFFRN